MLLLVLSIERQGFYEKKLSTSNLKDLITIFNVREMYILDNNYSFDISSIIFKKDCFLVKFDKIRAIFFSDKVYIIKDNNKYCINLINKIKNIKLDDNKIFHLQILDSILSYVSVYIDLNIQDDTPNILTLFEAVKNVNYNYNKFLLVQSNLLNLEYKIIELSNLTNELLENKQNLNNLYLDIDDTESVNDIIENYNFKFKDLENDARRLTREMNNVQDIVNIHLASNRNKYALFNIYISIASLSCGSFFGSMFGMNLKNNLEDSNPAFIIVFIMSILTSILIGCILNKKLNKY